MFELLVPQRKISYGVCRGRLAVCWQKLGHAARLRKSTLLYVCLGFKFSPRHRSVRWTAWAEDSVVGTVRPSLPVQAPFALRRSLGHACRQLSAIAVDAPGLSTEDLAAEAKRLGYRQIGQPVPDSVTLQQVIQSLPKEVSVAQLQL